MFRKSSMLLLILALVSCAFATDYYVESAPNPPELCNIARPCKYSNLPSVGSGDKVTFMAQTTGSSDIYSSGTFYKNGVEVVVNTDVIFDDFNLYVRHADATINAKTFRDTSTLFIIGDGNNDVVIDGTKVKHSIVRVANSNNFTFTGGSVKSFSGSDIVDVDAQYGIVRDITVDNNDSTENIFFFTTTSGDSDYEFSNIDFSNTDTTKNLIRISHENSNDANININNVDVTDCNMQGSIVSLYSPSKSGSTTHDIDMRFDDITGSGVKVETGMLNVINLDNGAKLTTNGDGVAFTGIDFENGSVLELTNSQTQGKNQVWLKNFETCSTIDQDYAAICFGNAQPILQGSTDGGTGTTGCSQSLIILANNC